VDKYLVILLIKTESLSVRGIALCEDSATEGLLLVLLLSGCTRTTKLLVGIFTEEAEHYFKEMVS